VQQDDRNRKILIRAMLAGEDIIELQSRFPVAQRLRGGSKIGPKTTRSCRFAVVFGA